MAQEPGTLNYHTQSNPPEGWKLARILFFCFGIPMALSGSLGIVFALHEIIADLLAPPLRSRTYISATQIFAPILLFGVIVVIVGSAFIWSGTMLQRKPAMAKVGRRCAVACLGVFSAIASVSAIAQFYESFVWLPRIPMGLDFYVTMTIAAIGIFLMSATIRSSGRILRSIATPNVSGREGFHGA